MKAVLVIVLALLALSLLFLCFIWLIAHGSGHNIPAKTNLGFAVSRMFNGLLIWLLWRMLKKVDQAKQETQLRNKEQ